MKVEIMPGCISCGACEAICSDVFTITDVAHVNENNITGNEDACRTAAEACPVSVIAITE